MGISMVIVQQDKENIGFFERFSFT